jgi:ATP-binding cassette subfamily F protein uup
MVRLGVNLEIATLDQKREAVDPRETLAHYLTDGRGETVVVNGEERHVASWMKDFLFKPEQARTPVRELSGGERARLILARVLSRPSNLLVLDEPTNDLDMETLDLLQELVAGFAGTVILVSPDRDFLDRTVTSTIAPNGDGSWTEYAGGYTDMLAQRGGRKLDDRKAVTKSPSEPRPAAEQKAQPKQPARKLSYKQKFALETLPKRMEAAVANIGAVERQLTDPDLYRRDPNAFADATASLDKARAELAAMEDEWLELEMLRETIEG